MNQDLFDATIQAAVKALYPKGKLKTAKGLTEAEILDSVRFEHPESYQQLKQTLSPPQYILVPESTCDQILDRFLETLPKAIMCYCTYAVAADGDKIDHKRIVFMNSENALEALLWEGVYSDESEISNEIMRSHFEELLKNYPIRIEEISTNIVAGSIQGDLKKSTAKTLAELMFQMNYETANFQSEDEEDEEDLDYEDDAEYYINKLTKHLMNDKTFFYWWD